MDPCHLFVSLVQFFTSFGGASPINLPPTEMMSNAVSHGALRTSRKMGSEQVIKENFTERQLQNN